MDLFPEKFTPVVPPRVEYMLSNRGKSLEQILRNLDAWGLEDSKKIIESYYFFALYNLSSRFIGFMKYNVGM